MISARRSTVRRVRSRRCRIGAARLVSTLAARLAVWGGVEVCADAAAASHAHAALIGGRTAARGTFRGLAYVRWSGRHTRLLARTCTGTVVAPNVVLTAAHCVLTLEHSANRNFHTLLPLAGFRVSTGNVDVATAAKVQVTPVSKIFVYPGYDASAEFGDAAVLILAKPTTDPAISLAHSAQYLQPGTAAIMSGWGETFPYGKVTAQNPHLTTTLRWGIVTVQGPAYCHAQAVATQKLSFWAAEQFCVIDPRFVVQGCYGDSGGPLLVEPTRTTILDIGIYSLGDPHCSPRVPAVYTRVDFVHGWVEQMIAAAKPRRGGRE